MTGTRADSPPHAPAPSPEAPLLSRAVSYPFALVIRAYQNLLSPLFPRTCKFHPTCSQYALDALRRYGLLRGLVLCGWRVLRCNPWTHGGVDRVEDQRLFR